jgi:hypothetical protein
VSAPVMARSQNFHSWWLQKFVVWLKIVDEHRRRGRIDLGWPRSPTRNPNARPKITMAPSGRIRWLSAFSLRLAQPHTWASASVRIDEHNTCGV